MENAQIVHETQKLYEENQMREKKVYRECIRLVLKDMRGEPKSPLLLYVVEPQGRCGCLWGKALFVCVGGARWEKACNRFVYLDNFFRR